MYRLPAFCCIQRERFPLLFASVRRGKGLSEVKLQAKVSLLPEKSWAWNLGVSDSPTTSFRAASDELGKKEWGGRGTQGWRWRRQEGGRSEDVPAGQAWERQR